MGEAEKGESELIQQWLEKDIYQLDQMMQTLEDYCTLSHEDIQHLNRFAKRTLLSTLPALLESIFIRISRLTEAAKPPGRENLTLGSLVHSLRAAGDSDKADLVDHRFQTLRKNTKTIREDYRNKRYAHIDFAVVMRTKQLPPVPVRALRQATEEIEALITFATNSGLSFQADQQGSIKHLARHLKDYYQLKTAH